MVTSQIDIKPGLTTGMLESLIHNHLPGGEQISFEQIPTGKFNTSFFVQVDDEPLILRIAPPCDSVFVFYERNMMRQEPELHRMLSETSVPVARILAFDDSHNLIDRDYLIMERLPGWPLTEMSRIDLDITLRHVGRSLAETHGLRTKAYGYLGVHRPMNPATTWAEAFLTMWHKLIDDILALRQYTQEEARFLRTLLDHHIPKFERPVPSSLLHMDVWHQNILVDSTGTLTGLVDWDRALWGDPEIEFAVLDYCGISKPAFWEGYGRKRDCSSEARIRQVFYLLYEIQKYIVIRLGRNNDPAAAQRYKTHVMEIAHQLRDVDRDVPAGPSNSKVRIAK